MARGISLTDEERSLRQRNAIRTQLALTSTSQVKSSAGNLIIVMQQDPDFQDQFAVHEMSQELFWKGELFQSFHVSDIQLSLQNHYGMGMSRSAVEEEARARGELNMFNPVRDYLKGLTWDGTSRMEKILTDVLHVEATPLYLAYVTKFNVAAVKRVMEPGCKFDSMFVLLGDQNLGKGRYFECMAGKWYGTIDGHKLQERDAKMALHYSWINEIQEIDKLSSKADARDLKSTASTREDIFRAPYAHTSKKYRRMFVLGGTGNEPEGMLVDFTGNRRWWVIEIPSTKVDIDLLETMRDQVWAEAVALYQTGYQIWLEDALAVSQMEASKPYEAYNPYQDLLEAAQRLIASRLHIQFNSKHIKGLTGQELFDLLQVPENLRIQASGNIMRVLAPVLKKQGWRKERKGGRGDQAVRWFPSDFEEIINTQSNGYGGMPHWGATPRVSGPAPAMPVVPLIPGLSPQS